MMRPRILFLSPCLPFPLNNGGRIRINNFLRALTEISSLDLICYGDWQQFHIYKNQLKNVPEWWDEFHSFQILQHPDWDLYDIKIYQKKIKRHPFSRQDLFYNSFPHASLVLYANHLANKADLIWAERLYMAPPFFNYSHKTIVDLDDLESVKIWRKALSEASKYTRFFMKIESDRLKITEKKAAKQFTRVIVCSSDDIHLFEEDSKKFWILPNGVDDDLLNYPPIPKDQYHLVFVGTLNYWPNEQGILFFFKEILPLIRTQVPDVVVSIVGLNPTSSIQSLHDGKRVFVHANVPKVIPYIQRATVSIVPLKAGGGTRLKILESLALGTPVVSTTIGAEGLDLQHGKHLLLADHPADFAEAVVRLLFDEHFRRYLCKEGKSRVSEKYLWSAIRYQIQEKVIHILKERASNHYD